MATAPHHLRARQAAFPLAALFGVSCAGFIAAAAALAALLPLQVSTAAVFLFAGPHNLLEARYMMGRLPARAGRLRPFFITACSGALVLAVAFAVLPRAAVAGLDGLTLHAVWNATFCAWVATLVVMRSRTNPRFDAGWVPAAAGVVAVLQWPWPWAFGLVIVFLHPVVALAVLDRELRRSRPEWLVTWRWAAAAVPLGIVVIHAVAASTTGLAGGSTAEDVIVRQAGIDILGVASTRGSLATHAFLELVHYGIWIVVLPIVGMGSAPWQIDAVPLARRGRPWAHGVAGVLVAGTLAMAVLWACFAVDYATTRHVYFTVAVLHVLAEIPFLLRML